MQDLKINISDVATHKDAVKQLLEYAKGEQIFVFDAPMGAGKTTFIKSLCCYLNVMDSVSSPTYSIVNEYVTSNNRKVFHFDLYRLKSEQELFDLGFNEYVNGDNYLFIEWPELSLQYFNSFLRIVINKEGNNRYLCAQIIKHT